MLQLRPLKRSHTRRQLYLCDLWAGEHGLWGRYRVGGGQDAGQCVEGIHRCLRMQHNSTPQSKRDVFSTDGFRCCFTFGFSGAAVGGASTCNTSHRDSAGDQNVAEKLIKRLQSGRLYLCLWGFGFVLLPLHGHIPSRRRGNCGGLRCFCRINFRRLGFHCYSSGALKRKQGQPITS